MKKPIALITGSSSGIGKATAFELAKNGFDLILNARRKELLYKLKKQIEAKYNVEVFISVFDVSVKDQVHEAFCAISNKFKHIDVLLNNAGLALGLNSIEEGIESDWETMLDTNVKGLLYVTKNAFPLLKKSRNPHIINIGSIAGKETYPLGNVYCATKHAVDSLSKALRMEFLKYEIKVTQISPGAVETDFSLVRFKGDKKKATEVYKGFKPLKPEDIAHIINFIISLPKHVNINDILIMPTHQATAGIIKREG